MANTQTQRKASHLGEVANPLLGIVNVLLGSQRLEPRSPRAVPRGVGTANDEEEADGYDELREHTCSRVDAMPKLKTNSG